MIVNRTVFYENSRLYSETKSEILQIKANCFRIDAEATEKKCLEIQDKVCLCINPDKMIF